jgi:hypothetical protein
MQAKVAFGAVEQIESKGFKFFQIVICGVSRKSLFNLGFWGMVDSETGFHGPLRAVRGVGTLCKIKS